MFFDTNGDGYFETIGYDADVDGDGWTEAIYEVDVDGDGWTDGAAVDYDYDGFIDEAVAW